ncbi:MAG: aspartate aminotransferase family protein [Candidatus Baltobacteraceae bacterium]
MNEPALLANYSRAPIRFVAGEGCYLIDENGRRYLDAIAGIAVCALGHAHPGIADAVARQARQLVHASNLYYHEPSGELARELTRRSGFARAFFCNSGTEANEAAIKLARKAAYRRGERERNRILAFSGGFHGRTLGALAATANPEYKVGFAPLPEGFGWAPFNDLAALDAAIDERTAACIIEPVQGESGVHPAREDVLQELRRLCSERGVLLIFDEVQCGMGRLGDLFAFQSVGVRPDLVTMAKALGNGLPIGAMLVDGTLADALQPGDHGSTFGGSPVSAAAALAHLRIRDELDLDTHVREVGAYAMTKLAALARTLPSFVEPPRGRGLLLGLPVREPLGAAAIAEALREHAILVGTGGGNTLRIAPPLIVSNEEIDRLVDAIGSVVAGMGARATK